MSIKSVIVKVSGECFCPAHQNGIRMESVLHLASQLRDAASNGVKIGVVMGGGNIMRGSEFKAANSNSQTGQVASIETATAHEMGMLATIINGLALQDAIRSIGCDVRLMSALPVAVAELYDRRRAKRHWAKGRIVLFSGGTGLPFVTTDTGAAQRAVELGADMLLKATKVDGVYSSDPVKNSDATFFPEISYDDFLSKELRVLDQECVVKCRENKLPIRVFNYRADGNLAKAVNGEPIGTLII
ncbi:MAG: UMP kinase [Thermoguttaceae bacterium]